MFLVNSYFCRDQHLRHSTTELIAHSEYGGRYKESNLVTSGL